MLRRPCAQNDSDCEQFQNFFSIRLERNFKQWLGHQNAENEEDSKREESAFQQTEREKKRYGNGRAPPPRHGADGASDAVQVLLKPWCELLNALLYGS